jgi:regulator of protease activity HflC (stomatin/prohibitin superfamily)
MATEFSSSKKAPTYFDEDSNDATFEQPPVQQPHPSQFQQPIITQQPDAIKLIKYAKTYETQKQGTYQSLVQKAGTIFGLCGMVPCLCCSNPYHDVQQGTVGLITKFGELSRVVDPGSTYVNIFSENLRQVSIKTEVQDIPEQACLTKDNVIVYLKSVIYYNIVDPQRAVFAISNIHEAVSERTQTTLRDVIGARVLQDVIERREEIAEAIQAIIAETAAEWGVRIESILIKDLRLSSEITQALSQAAQARRIGESRIIQAKSEVEASKLMRESARLLNSKVAVQMRYLDAMINMAKTANSKVIFMPTSVDIDQSRDGPEDDFSDEENAVLDTKKASSSNANSGISEDLLKRLALQEGTVGDHTK